MAAWVVWMGADRGDVKGDGGENKGEFPEVLDNSMALRKRVDCVCTDGKVFKQRGERDTERSPRREGLERGTQIHAGRRRCG